MLLSSDCEQPRHEMGKRLLLNHIDLCASRTPDKIAFYQVLCEERQERVVPLTYASLRNLIDQLAWWIDGLRLREEKQDTPIG